MSDRAETYDFALVLDNPRTWFEAAARVLRAVRARYESDELLSIDLLYLDDGPLFCLLHFHWDMFGPDLPHQLKLTTEGANFRILEPMLLTPDERARFYEASTDKFQIKFVRQRTLGRALEELSARILGPPVKVETEKSEQRIKLSLEYRSAEDFLRAYGDTTLGRGLFVKSDALPDVGQAVQLKINTMTGQGPIVLTGRVVFVRGPEVAEQQGADAGFGVGFLLPPDEKELFESFENAVRRGASWPERSGRRHERFPIQMRVEYDYQGDFRREHTVNISRGGMFVESFDPPPPGTLLAFVVHGPATSHGAVIEGECVYRVTPEQATQRGVACGVGVRFTESSSTVLTKLKDVLASVSVEATRRALVVDDDQFFRSIIGNVLRLGGFEVLEAQDGIQAFELCLEELLALDLLVVDIFMPGMTGAELIDKIQRVGSTERLTTVVVTGAEFSEPDRDALLSVGAEDVIPKSLEPVEILVRIEELMESKGRPPSE